MWIHKRAKIEDEGIDVWYLVEGDWIRGRVEGPGMGELAFLASSYGESQDRAYLTKEAAMDRLEYCARVEDLRETDALTEGVKFGGPKQRRAYANT